MTKAHFEAWPGLLMTHHVMTIGYGRATLEKFVDCGVLKRIRPTGCHEYRYQKKQVAVLLDWLDVVKADEARFALEPLMLRATAVQLWTGWGEKTLVAIALAGGLKLVRWPGTSERRFLKGEIAELLGFKI